MEPERLSRVQATREGPWPLGRICVSLVSALVVQLRLRRGVPRAMATRTEVVHGKGDDEKVSHEKRDHPMSITV